MLFALFFLQLQLAGALLSDINTNPMLSAAAASMRRVASSYLITQAYNQRTFLRFDVSDRKTFWRLNTASTFSSSSSSDIPSMDFPQKNLGKAASKRKKKVTDTGLVEVLKKNVLKVDALKKNVPKRIKLRSVSEISEAEARYNQLCKSLYGLCGVLGLG